MSKENDLNEIFQYKYNTDDLDKIIEQENKGIRMMIPGDMRVEVDLRKKELLLEAQNEMNDEELEEFLSEENTTEVIKKHKSIIQNKIEQERRNAHVDEYITLDITDEEKAMMEELCATSYVRELPGVSYHKAESELYDSDERKQILQKVKRIGNVYYTIEDWRNAMMILLEAYDYFYKNDYKDTPDFVKKGHVIINRQMPTLILNYRTRITDKEMLKEILNGNVRCFDKNEDTGNRRQRAKAEDVKGIPFHKIGRRMSQDEYDYQSHLARMGNNDSFLLAASRVANTVYNRYSPDALNSNKNKTEKRYTNDKGEFITFDFTQPGMGKKMYEFHNRINHTTCTDLASDIMEANEGKITNSLSSSVFQDCFRALAGKPGSSLYNNYTTPAVNPQLNPKSEVIAQEQALLNIMRQYNPSKTVW